VTSTTWNEGPILAYPQATSLTPPPSPIFSSPTVQITSHKEGQRVPEGELTIKGISSDNEKTDCQVYADVNDMTPMRNVTATGTTGNSDDFSDWAFTYTEQYELIKEGENELTAKISCVGSRGSGTPMSEWHTLNLTGLSTTAASSFISPPSFSSSLPSTDDAQTEYNGREGEEDTSAANGAQEESDGDEE
jgi:hypothetical protein